jgi:Protein of unknown function (DUF742)
MAGDAASTEWEEPRGGRVVPVYAVTGGRTRANEGPDMPVEALVTTTDAGVFPMDLQLEYRMTVELASTPVSIVEIGASLGVPVGVARVLVSDLVNAKYLVVHLPPEPSTADGSLAPEILERLLEGLRAR